MTQLEELLTRLEELVGHVEQLDEATHGVVFELLDGIDALHRFSLHTMAAGLPDDVVARLRAQHPAVEWLFDAYAIGVDERAAVDQALESVRPYIQSHGGSVELLDVEAGVVRLRLSGTCSGCTASDVTVSDSIESALREAWPGFAAVEVQVDEAPAHPPPPASTLVQIGGRPPGL